MDTKFSVVVTQFKTVSQLPNAWSEKEKYFRIMRF